MSIDLNALAAQLAQELATADYPRTAADAETAGAAEREPDAPPGVTFTTGEARVGDVVDHTLLRPDATLVEIERLCAEAREHRLAAVCVNPVWVPDCVRLLRGSDVRVATVIGFPFGATASIIKAAEAALAVSHGARELDTVVPLGALRAGHWDEVERDVAEVVGAAGEALVKVVLEAALLPPMALVRACHAVRDAGAHYVKTSTGFHAAGGATPETVALMRLAVGDALGVKASGGIRDGATALAMLAAGATRIGTTAGVAIADVRGPGVRSLGALVRSGGRAEGGAAPAAPPAAAGSPATGGY